MHIREGTLKMRLNDKEEVFRVYKACNTPSHYRDIYVITMMEVNECRVKEYKLPITSLNSLIELPNLTNKPELAKLEWNYEKAGVQKFVDLNFKNLRVQQEREYEP